MNKLTRSMPSLKKVPVDGMAFQLWTFLITVIICTFGVSVNVAGYTIRPERVLVVIWLLTIVPLVPKLGLQKLPLLLLGWLVLGLYSSLLSDQPGFAIRHWLDLSLAVGFFYVCLSAPLQFFITRRLTALLWLSTVLGGGAILTAVIHSFYFSTTSLETADPIWSSLIMNDWGYGFRIRMTLMEANLFGIAMAVFSLLSVAELKKAEKWTWLPFALSHAGLFLAFSRGPLIGYVMGLAVYIFMAKDRRLWLKFWGMAFALLVFFPTELPFTATVHDQAATVHDQAAYRKQTAGVRLLAVSAAMPDIISKPIIGNGVYSFSFLHPDFSVSVGAKQEDAAWISVMPIAILHDTGVLGFVLFYSFLASVLYRGYKATAALRELSESPAACRAAAWLGAAISISIASLATAAYSLALFWGVFAICYYIPRVLTLPAQDPK